MKSFKQLIQPARSWANYAFFREYRYHRKVRRHLKQYYSPEAPESTCEERMVVCMADGKCHHGGLADRLRSFVTYYGYCLEHGLRFAIHFDFPFRLEEYLQPNRYDWTLKPGELTYNSRQAHAVYMDNTSDEGPRELRYQRRMSRKLLSSTRFLQHHVYSSFYYDEANFGRYFHELFRPSARVQAALDLERQTLGANYISVSARFLELLGDFKEPKATLTLYEHGRKELVERCVAKIKELHTKWPDRKILVTSDSRRFLDACRHLDYVHVADGQISHVDVAGGADHTKTFVDFLLISGAERVFQIKTPPMYGGNFSLRAAQAGNRPHTLITF